MTSIDDSAVIENTIQSSSSPLLTEFNSKESPCPNHNVPSMAPTAKLAHSIGVFIDKVTSATNAVIEGSSLTGCAITPVSVLNEDGSGPYTTPLHTHSSRRHHVMSLPPPPSLQYQKTQSLNIHQGAIRSLAAAAASRLHSQPAEMFDKVFKSCKKVEDHMKNINYHLKSAVLMGGSQGSIKLLHDIVEENGVCSTRISTSVVIANRMVVQAEEAMKIAKCSVMVQSNQNSNIDYTNNHVDINKVENERNEIIEHIRETRLKKQLPVSV
eukprot:Tbor_TRINITY_DN4598_c0_g2::TRINITY_DN4598_c0_g2_i2::g.15764::m.15764